MATFRTEVDGRFCMPLQIVRNDITKMECDAIVNAANESLGGGGGVDGAIHRAAGPGLHEECMTLGGCRTGDAKVTGGYALSCRYIIHTVGPRYRDGRHGERELLASCYRTSLRLAMERGCESVAFPLISAGIYGYPKEQAMQVAVSEISRFLSEHELTVYLVVYDRDCFWISKKLVSEIREYIDERYVKEHEDQSDRSRELFRAAPMPGSVPPPAASMPVAAAPMPGSAPPPMASMPAAASPQMQYAQREASGKPKAAKKPKAPGKKRSLWRSAAERLEGKMPPDAAPPMEDAAGLGELVNQLDESFSQMLLRKIDERGMTDAECYKKANVDRKLFSKIRGDVYYRPGRMTVLAFAVALELSLAETQDMMRKAGFALSHSNKADIIVEYFITRQIYNVFEINEALFAFDQCLLGSGMRQ